MLDEQEFRSHCDHAIEKLFRRLSDASDDYDFEVDMNAGALAVEFEDPPGKFVVSPNAPVRQIWISALTKSFKLDWDEHRSTFALPNDGPTLDELMSEVIGTQLGEEVEL